MQKYLMILEVSQKQAYIFGSRVLKENIRRSAQIAYVTGSDFFERVCPGGYSREKNLVYSGGGHTVLQFDTKEAADALARAVTKEVLCSYPEMELFVKTMAFDENEDPGACLNELSRALEEKKAKRELSFRLFSLGIEKEHAASASENSPENVSREAVTSWMHAGNKPWRLSDKTDEIAGDDNFLAVIHIDGNAMGTRVQNIYEACSGDWEKCKQTLRLFSRSIDEDFAEAYEEMAKELGRELEQTENTWWREKNLLPLRKIVGAGDDVCFITAGYYGLECAASFLRHLSSKQNKADGQYYTACAGVVLIHTKFPFRRAYDLSETLCSSAKVFAAGWGGNISAIDYHIEFGQLKDSLSEIREDYRTDDGGCLELRPLAVAGSGLEEVESFRQYNFLRELLNKLKRPDLARGKLKELRSAFRQGEQESKLAMRMTQTERILLNIIKSVYPDSEDPEVFITDESGNRRCLLFDAIEIADNIQLWQGR